MAVRVRYHDLKPSEISKHLPNLPYRHFERAFMIAAIGCAILSLIPNIGTAGAVALRTVSCTMIGVRVIGSLKNNETKGTLFLQITYLASVTLGLVGVAANLKSLVLAAIVTDLALQTLQTARQINRNNQFKTLCHASFILTDSFFMISLLSSGWGFLATAALLNSVTMIAFTIKESIAAFRHKESTAVIDAICTGILGVIGIGSAVRSGSITPKEFPTLPVGATAVVTMDSPSKQMEKVSPQIERILPIRFCPDQKKQPLWLVNARTVVEIDLVFARRVWPHLDTVSEGDKILLDLSPKVFDCFAEFLNEGYLDGLDALSEKELLVLYNTADDFEISMLRRLCHREVALRLKDFKWENTALFAPYLRQPRPLNTVLALFSFSRRSFLEEVF